MSTNRHLALGAVNREVAGLLRRVDGLVHGTGDIGAAELRRVRRLLEAMGPEVKEALANGSVDALLRRQIETYAENLKALESSLNQVKCVMLARRARMDAAQRHVDGLRGWVNAYRQTAP
jgi:hypothetical protein